MGKLTYRPEIDGMRAIAVLAVVLFHAGFGFSGGYVGVDVFFVISGFLITGLVLKDIRANRFHFIEFWERRIRRIFPACATMVVLTLVAAVFLLFPFDTEDLAKSAMAQMLLSANFYFLDQTGYFQGAAELKPLLHTWSLAVEEQFYLVFPFLLVFWKRLSESQLRWRLSLLALASFALSVWGTYSFPDATFYMLPMRAWEMMIGSLLAVTVPTSTVSRKVNESLSWLGLAGILFATIWYDSSTRFPGASAFLPCLGAALLIYANTNSLTTPGRLLATRPMVFIGKLSYSLYLWHWPVLAILRSRSGIELSLELRLAALVLSFVLGWLSWKFVETPMRSPLRMSRKWVYSLSTACSLSIVVVSAILAEEHGFPSRCSAEVVNILENGKIADRFEKPVITPIGPELKAGEHGQFLLWGDSHAQAVSELIHELAVKHNLPGYVAARSSTVPVLGTWRYNEGREGMEWKDEVIAFVKEKQIKNLILVSRWSINIDGRPNGSMKVLLADEKTGRPTPETAQEAFRRGLHRTIKELEETGAKVWLVRQMPQQNEDIRRLLARRVMFGIKEKQDRVTLEEHYRYQAHANKLLDEARSENVHVIDPTRFCFDETGHARIWDDRLPYYSDDHHLSRYGAEQMLKPFFEPVITEIAHDVQLAKKTPDAKPIQLSSEPASTVVR